MSVLGRTDSSTKYIHFIRRQCAVLAQADKQNPIHNRWLKRFESVAFSLFHSHSTSIFSVQLCTGRLPFFRFLRHKLTRGCFVCCTNFTLIKRKRLLNIAHIPFWVIYNRIMGSSKKTHNRLIFSIVRTRV